MKLSYSLFILSLFVSCSTLFGQFERDSILLLNGRVYFGTITSTSGDFITYTEPVKKGKVMDSQIDKYRVFSYTQGTTQTIVYKQKGDVQNFLTVQEAMNATIGSYDARQTFRPGVAFWSTMVISYGVSLYDTYLSQSTINNPDYIGGETSAGLFKANPSIGPILVPLVFTAAWAFPSFKIRKKQMIHLDLKGNVDYYRGFHRVARQKRMLGALRGGLIGIGAGLVSYAIFR